MITVRHDAILRVELADNPVVIGPWPVAAPGYVVFFHNMGSTDAVVHIKGGQSPEGPFARSYGADSVVTVPAYGRATPAVVTDIAKYVALHLTETCPDGVRVEIHSYYPVPNQDIAREQLSVV